MAFLTKFFRKKESEIEIPKLEEKIEVPKIEEKTMETLKAKMDLILAQLDSLATQYQVLNEKINLIEKMLKELYSMAKS